MAVLACVGVAGAHAEYSFRSLGLPPGASAGVANGVSGDGHTVVGQLAFAGRVEAFSWTVNGGYRLLGDVPGGPFNSGATAVSRDGRTIVGFGRNGNNETVPVKWVDGILQNLAHEDTPEGQLLAVSRDGTHVAGLDLSGPFPIKARFGPPYEYLGDLDQIVWPGFATGITDDGLTVVLYDMFNLKGQYWRSGIGSISEVPDLAGGNTDCIPRAIDALGFRVVGASSSTLSTNTGYEAFIWYREDQNSTPLGALQSDNFPDIPHDSWSAAYAISADGKLVVGDSSIPNLTPRAMIWTEHSQMLDLKKFLIDGGNSIQNVQILTARGVSDDGNTVAGTAIVEGMQVPFVSIIPVPQPRLDSVQMDGGVTAGEVAIGTVSLGVDDADQPILAIAEGALVKLSDNSNAVHTPATAYIPAGNNSATFQVPTDANISSPLNVTITARLQGVTETTNLAVTPAIKVTNLTFNPPSVAALTNSTATVTIETPAPINGNRVNISSGSSAITVPNQVIVPGGQTTATFTVQTKNVSTETIQRPVTVSSGGVSKTKYLTITPAIRINNAGATPASVQAGNSTTVQVSLTGVAPAGGATVTVSSQSSILSAPAQFTIPAGQTSGSFNVGTNPVDQTYTRSITLTYNQVSKLVYITVTPGVILNGVLVQPSTVKGGTATQGRINLNGPAPAGGALIQLQSTSSAVSVPATVTVPAGQTTVTFTINTSAVGATYTRYVKATWNSVTRSAAITLTP